MRCNEKTEHGPCQQDSQGPCSYHAQYRTPGFYVDRFYHRKVVAGQATLTDTLTEAQVRLLFRGKEHKDGRAADQWVS